MSVFAPLLQRLNEARTHQNLHQLNYVRCFVLNKRSRLNSYDVGGFNTPLTEKELERDFIISGGVDCIAAFFHKRVRKQQTRTTTTNQVRYQGAIQFY